MHLTQQIDSPPQQPRKQPPPKKQMPTYTVGIIILLVLIGLLLLLFTGLLVRNVSQSIRSTLTPVTSVTPAATVGRTPTATPTETQEQDGNPITLPGGDPAPSLQLPTDRSVVYEQQDAIYMVGLTGGKPQLLSTQGYIYNRAVPPLMTASGQLLYSGDGLWLTDIFAGTNQQIAPLDANQVITSMVLSSDGTHVAWSTEPVDGKGTVSLYVMSLIQGAAPTLVYQQDATDCPCYRVFSYLDTGSTQHTLLLTDDQGDHRAVSYGLWSLDIDDPTATPQPLLDENPLRGPLVLVPHTNMLLYTSFEGVVAVPADNSVPSEIAALNYANSLVLATLAGKPPAMGASHTVLPEQHSLSNTADYHWVAAPLATPDGHTLVYTEFSSDTQYPYDRHSALYTVSISGSGKQTHIGAPQLLGPSPSLFIELGAWIDNHTITLYSDEGLYGLDIQSGAITKIVQTGSYVRAIAVVGQGAS